LTTSLKKKFDHLIIVLFAKLRLPLMHICFFFLSNSFVARAHTLNVEKWGMQGSNADPYINYVMSLPIELSSWRLSMHISIKTLVFLKDIRTLVVIYAY